MSSSQPAAGSKEGLHRTRQVRKMRYKRLLDDGSLIGESAESDDVFKTLQTLQGILQQSNSLVTTGDLRERIEDTSEMVLDAQVLKMSHELFGTAVRGMDDGGEFDEDQFAQIVRGLMGPSSDDGAGSAAAPSSEWQRLFDIAAPLGHTFGWSQCMLGTFEASTGAADAETETRQRQQRQTARATSSQQVKPEEVAALSAKEKPAQVLNEILKQLKGIFERNGDEPIAYYGTVVDPQSFMNTVDNCFQVAFLFRDGHLLLDVDDGDDGMPAIRPVMRADQSNAEFEHQQQFISPMSPKLWQQMIERYNLEEPVLVVNRDLLSATQQQTQS